MKHIPLITKEEEATMWEKGVHSTSSGGKCIFLNGEKKTFASGSKERRELKLSQFVRNKDH